MAENKKSFLDSLTVDDLRRYRRFPQMGSNGDHYTECTVTRGQYYEMQANRDASDSLEPLD